MDAEIQGMCCQVVALLLRVKAQPLEQDVNGEQSCDNAVGHQGCAAGMTALHHLANNNQSGSVDTARVTTECSAHGAAFNSLLRVSFSSLYFVSRRHKVWVLLGVDSGNPQECGLWPAPVVRKEPCGFDRHGFCQAEWTHTAQSVFAHPQ